MKNLVLLLSSILVACSTVPETIQSPPSYDLQLENVAGNVVSYTRSSVRWGGQIVVVNNDDKQTVMQIVQFPLNHYGKPMTSKKSQGRFLSVSKQFYDPVIYKAGSLITLTGVIDSEQARLVDKKTLHLPVVKITLSYLWPKRRPYSAHHYGYSHYYPYRGYGYHGLYYYSPYRHHYY